jgi:predicted MFS family arabinose efflux permease
MWGSVGSMAGPILGGVIVSCLGSSLFSYRMAFLSSMTVAIISYITVAYVSRGQAATHGSFEQTKHLFKPRGIWESYLSGIHLTRHRGVQFGLMGTFLIMFIQALYTSFIPLYLNAEGYSVFTISIVVSLTGLAGLTSRFLLDRLTRRTTLEKILITAGCLASACLILIPVASLHVVGICFLTFVLGSAVGINLPVSIMIMVDDTLDNERGKVMGLRLLMNRFSQMLSPALFGMLGQTLGLTFAFYTGGGLLLATMLGFAAFSSSKLTEPVAPGNNAAD